MAMLELTRQRKIEVEQDPESGIITLEARVPDNAEERDAVDSSPNVDVRDDGVLAPEVVDNA